MKTKVLFFVACAALFSPGTSNATVTLQFAQTGVGRASNFGNASDPGPSVATNGMSWGLVISTADASFEGSGVYDPIVNPTISQFLTKNNGAVVTDDWYHATGLSTVNSTATGVNGDLGGAGSITSATNVPFGVNGIGQNDVFGIIWMATAPTASSYYGLLTNPAFLIPADSGNVSYAGTVFNGPDPLKPANQQFAAVPEPSRMILIALGSIGLAARRRRK